MTTNEIGFITIVIAGFMEGNFAIPMKYMPRWNWENLWLAYSVFGLLVLPWAVVVITVPEAVMIYGQASPREIWIPFLFGALWGVGNVLCGLGVAIVGSGLGISIVVGLSAAIGTLVPLVTLNLDIVPTRRGLLILSGVAVMVIGVLVCAIAGMRRESTLATEGQPKGNLKGILLCIISGIASASINLALAYGSPLRSRAEDIGYSPNVSANLVWAWAMTGSFIINMAYCLYLLWKNRSLAKYGYRGTGRYWFYSGLMGILLTGGIMVYGFGAASLGALGISIGWAIFLCFTILSANISGFVTGEWRGAATRATSLMIVGSVLLIAAAGVVGYANIGS